MSSSLLSAFLTYVIGIKRAMKERITSEQMKLYARAIAYMQDLPDRLKDHSEENFTELASEFHSFYNELLLFAPDNILNALVNAMKQVRKGATAQPLFEFIILLRKELMPSTKLQSTDIISAEFRA